MNWAEADCGARPIQSNWDVLHGCFTATQRGGENGSSNDPTRWSTKVSIDRGAVVKICLLFVG
jgi:hypothetical protein